MPTDVIMPQMGESIFEGTITKWLKKAGDSVEKDEPLFEISTDKVDAEIPSPVAGVLTEIKAPVGATVEVNAVVAVIGEAALVQGASSEAGKTGSYSGEISGKYTAGAKAQHSLSGTYGTTELPPHRRRPVDGGPGEVVPCYKADATEDEAVVLQVAGQRQRSSPLVRCIAKDNNLDLGQIIGTGSEGRITKEDILLHLSKHGPGTIAPKEQLAPPQVVATPQVPQEPQPLSKMRSIIAQRMVESVRISPHAHTVYKIDMTRIVRLREREKGSFEQRHGVKLTYMPFIAAAAAQALVKFPIVNASMIDGAIHYHQNVNLGIAVALEWGLIVPVVRQAESRSFVELARAIADLAARARAKKLLPDEVQGGTFTLTNSGVFGGEYGTPIINQPESAILAIGGLRKEPVVLTDAEGNDTIAIRSMQHYCLGFDHRTIDGADSGKFMSELQRTLESWEKPIG
jgi:2-oxoglutarate dehydrogenase E2 component (dihydrolipoamide succinyltransferase)